MYEYKTEMLSGNAPPTLLNTPKGFRLYKIEPIELARFGSNSMNYECDSLGNRRPYITSSTRNSNYNWLIVWERYVPEEENE